MNTTETEHKIDPRGTGLWESYMYTISRKGGGRLREREGEILSAFRNVTKKGAVLPISMGRVAMGKKNVGLMGCQRQTKQ